MFLTLGGETELTYMVLRTFFYTCVVFVNGFSIWTGIIKSYQNYLTLKTFFPSMLIPTPMLSCIPGNKKNRTLDCRMCIGLKDCVNLCLI